MEQPPESRYVSFIPKQGQEQDQAVGELILDLIYDLHWENNLPMWADLLPSEQLNDALNIASGELRTQKDQYIEALTQADEAKLDIAKLKVPEQKAEKPDRGTKEKEVDRARMK